MIGRIYVVGITGNAGSGKDTFAKAVRNVSFGEFSLTAVAMAIREVVEIIWGVETDTQEEKAAIVFGDITGRFLLQEVGKKMREIDPDAWIKALKTSIRNYECEHVGIIIVTDIRYQVEADICDEVWRIVRPDHSILEGREAQHESEKSIDKVIENLVIMNDGTLEELQTKARTLAEEVLLRAKTKRWGR